GLSTDDSSALPTPLSGHHGTVCRLPHHPRRGEKRGGARRGQSRRLRTLCKRAQNHTRPLAASADQFGLHQYARRARGASGGPMGVGLMCYAELRQGGLISSTGGQDMRDRLREPDWRFTLCTARSMPSNNAKRLLSWCFAVTEHL